MIELEADGSIAGDDDLDGVRSADNCPLPQHPNPWQWNADGDIHGDACDGDDDDGCDLQPRRSCKGFACLAELDSDRDGVADWRDTCPTAPDPAQLDGDGDGLGDVCDPDQDQDGVPDVYRVLDLLCDPLVCVRR